MTQQQITHETVQCATAEYLADGNAIQVQAPGPDCLIDPDAHDLVEALEAIEQSDLYRRAEDTLALEMASMCL